VAHLTEDALFQFANMTAVSGRQAIAESVAGFFDSIRSLRHMPVDYWDAGDAVVCRAA
jgi:hypothetical protein